mgnify:CR=1 FL=1
MKSTSLLSLQLVQLRGALNNTYLLENQWMEPVYLNKEFDNWPGKNELREEYISPEELIVLIMETFKECKKIGWRNLQRNINYLNLDMVGILKVKYLNLKSFKSLKKERKNIMVKFLQII